jgi:hypothetical protein
LFRIIDARRYREAGIVLPACHGVFRNFLSPHFGRIIIRTLVKIRKT